MTIHKFFPSVVYQERLNLSDKLIKSAIKYILTLINPDNSLDNKRITIGNNTQNLHCDKNLEPQMTILAAAIDNFVTNIYKFDKRYCSFAIGRSWPVIQYAGGFGHFHYHVGSVFSGVLYLQMPNGAGGIEFNKPTTNVADYHYKTEMNELNSDYYQIFPTKGDLLLFNSEIRHRGLPSSENQKIPRIAIAFDVYTLSDIRNVGGGIPHISYLKDLKSYIS